MNRAKSVSVVGLTLLLVLCMFVGIGLSLGEQAVVAQADTEQAISLDGLQMRGAINGWYYYLVLQSDSYSGLTATESVADKSTLTLDKIKLYTSESDTGTALSKLTVQHVDQNFGNWTNGLFINFAEYDSAYGGHQVYKVVVEKGCKLPYKKDDTVGTYVVDKTYTFYNGSYGDESAKLGAMSWAGETYETVSLDGIQLRGVSDNAWYQYLVLKSSYFKDSGVGENIESGTFVSTLNKIKLYTVDEQSNLVEKKMSDLSVSHIDRNFGYAGNPWEYGAFIGFNKYSENDGSKVYKVTVEKDCVIAFASTNSIKHYVVVDNDYTFYNSSYGNSDNAYGALTSTTTPTIAYGTTEETISLDGIQLRGIEGNFWYQYLVLLSSAYDSLSEVENVATKAPYCDLSGIKLYTVSDGELTEKNFNEFTTKYVGRNKWGAKGGFIQFSEFENGYDGSSVYKVTVAAGTKIVAEIGEKATVFVVDKDYVFFNISFGDESKKFGSSDWLDYVPETTEITLSGLQMRGFTDNGWYQYLVLKSAAYNDLAAVESVNYGKKLLTADRIKMYTSKTEFKTLGELTVQHIDQNFSGWEKGVFVNYQLYSNGYAGNNIYKVVVEKGAKIPYTADDKLAFFVVDSDYTFYNMSYGNEANAYSSCDWVVNEPARETLLLNNLQMRGWSDNEWYQYLLLCSTTFDGLDKIESSVLPGLSFDKVKFYLSKDGEGTTLQQLGVNHIDVNFWDAKAAYINLKNFASYSGSTVYKVTIEKGFEIPVYRQTDSGTIVKIYVTDKDYTFYNMSYGNEANAYSSCDWVVNEPSKETLSLSGIQMRGLGENDWYQYLVLRSDTFVGLDKVESIVASGLKFDKIKLYLSNDGEAISLQQLGVKHVDFNMWDIGAYINFANYATYNGSSVYKVTIEKGFEIPLYRTTDDGTIVKIYVVDKAYTFYNVNYNKEDAKFSAFEWWNTPVPETVENSGEIEVVKVSNQSDGTSRWLILWFNEKFVGTTNVSFYETKGFTNVLDNVYLYSGNDLSQTPVKLRDIFTGTITVGQFGSPDAIGFTIKNDERYDGTNTYLVVVKQGCEMPFIKDGEYSKRAVSADTTFVNNDFGKTGEIPGSTGSDSRLYKNFAIDWSKAVFVTYKVVGVEDLTFDKQCLIVGTQVDMSMFAKDGYELTVTDNIGYTYYGTIYIPSKDVEITLAYTKAEQPEPTPDNGGCNGVVATSGALVLFAATAAAAFVSKKKRK